MKRILFGLFISLLALTACNGGDDEDERSTTDTNESAATSPTATVAQEDEPTATTEAVEEEPTPEPTATPEPQPTATPEPTPTPDMGNPQIDVEGHAMYETSYGGTYIMGVARNTGDGDAAGVQIVASLYDDDGSIVASADNSNHLSLIPAGSVLPFVIATDQAQETWTEERFQVQYQPVESNGPSGGHQYFHFDVLQVNWSPGDYESNVVGEISNVGDATAERVVVYVSGFGPDDEFLFSAFARVSLDQVSPGMDVSFSATLPSSYDGPEPSSIEVIAAGRASNQ